MSRFRGCGRVLIFDEYIFGFETLVFFNFRDLIFTF